MRVCLLTLVGLIVIGLYFGCSCESSKGPDTTVRSFVKRIQVGDWETLKEMITDDHMTKRDMQLLEELFASSDVHGIETEIIDEDTLNARVLIALVSYENILKIGIEPVQLVSLNGEWKLAYQDSLPSSLTPDNFLVSDQAGWQGLIGHNQSEVGRYLEAIKHYKKAISLRPDVALAYWGLGVAYAELADYDRAISALKQAIDFEPRNAKIHYNLAGVYRLTRRYDDAILSYRHAINIDTCFVEAYANLASLYNELADYDAAVEVLNAILEIVPNHAFAYSNRGHTYLFSGQPDYAMRDFKKALELNPQHKDAYVGAAIACYQKGEKETALAYYTKAIAIDGRYSDLQGIRDLGTEGIHYSESQLQIINTILQEVYTKHNLHE